jgi:5-methyltetrahydropteroyltriglutamate--homocysteine methyltransferase
MTEHIKTTVVGSYPVPSWLTGNSSRLVLRDAVMVVLKTQELAGLDLIADGELSRFDPGHPETNGMIDYFVGQMEGIKMRFSMAELQHFYNDRSLGYRALPAGMVVSRVEAGTLNLAKDYESVRALTSFPLKFTCTGPHMLSRVLIDYHYRERAELAMDLARILRRQLESVGAEVVQLDEANIAGHPEDAGWAVEAINHVLDGIPIWRDLVPFLNQIRTDHLVLEFARRGYDELELFRDLNPNIRLGIGVVDIKDNEIETPQLIAGRIETIVKTLGEGRLKYIHPDCGFWMLHRSVVDRKMRALVEGRDLFEGREERHEQK